MRRELILLVAIICFWLGLTADWTNTMLMTSTFVIAIFLCFFLYRLRRHNENQEVLMNHLRKLKQRVMKNTVELLKGASDVRDIKAKHTDLLVQLDVSRRCCEDKKAELKTLTETVNALEQQMLEKQKIFSAEIEKLQQNTDLYSRTLGFKIGRLRSNSKYHIMFIFTNIDQQEPEKMFTISVKLTDDGTYKVTDCRPLIPDLGRIVARLNLTDHWHSFFIIIRQRFVSIVSQQSDARPTHALMPFPE